MRSLDLPFLSRKLNNLTMDPNINYTVQKHSLEVFHKKCILENFTISTEKHLRQRHFLDKVASPKKGILENFAIFTGKHLRQSLFFNKVADPRHATLFKKRLWHRCFSVHFSNFLKHVSTIFYQIFIFSPNDTAF